MSSLTSLSSVDQLIHIFFYAVFLFDFYKWVYQRCWLCGLPLSTVCKPKHIVCLHIFAYLVIWISAEPNTGWNASNNSGQSKTKQKPHHAVSQVLIYLKNHLNMVFAPEKHKAWGIIWKAYIPNWKFLKIILGNKNNT